MGGTSSQSQNQNGTNIQQTTPWAPAAGALQGVLGNLSSINPNLTAGQTSAINQLSGYGAAGNPYASAYGNVANNLFAGGGANNQAGLINNAYGQYQQQLSPYLQQSFLDPRNTPGFGDALSALNSDITSQVNGQFAAAGRDMSGMNSQALARGLSQGEGQLLANQYNQNVGNQLGAMNSLYGAGNQTGGLLSGLQQQAVQNQQAGIGAGEQAFQAGAEGPMLQLQAEAMRTGIPLQTLAAQAGIALPAAQAFGQTIGNTNQAAQGYKTASGADVFKSDSAGLKDTIGSGGWLTGLGAMG